MLFMNQEKNDLERYVCFLHIPKTGGKSLWAVLKAQEEDIMVRHGMFFKKFDKPYTYLTMLRDPIDRVVSTYYYVHGYEKSKIYPKVKDMDLKQFLSYMKDEKIQNRVYPQPEDIRNIKYRTSNLATRYISGGEPDHLEIAKQNIEHHFSFVGFTDMYVESLYLLSKCFPWEIKPFAVKTNVTPHRQPLNEIPAEAIQWIKECNRADIELYQWAKQAFLKKLDQLDTSSKQELKQWKKDLQW
ncbi:sulfotransferase family 2 domain-containing protein [Halobacillus salinarum]|uniref:Sulfotransferase family 2 domain-containing protein n=1 Tax=Halobacillus salinarum TaxID=2932257 RepID=A0ABY4EJU6_9BACI|nr:sulfotransferase family 2 domain-containing protein [Halobacillus salinarum]UOQ44133.1 sulfotransferase family 2 domain-containing protein [Halobacillus salinarum]